MTLINNSGAAEYPFQNGADNGSPSTIVSMLQRVMSLEALSRGPSNSALHSPSDIVSPRRASAVYWTELEMLCRRKAVRPSAVCSFLASYFSTFAESLLKNEHYRAVRCHVEAAA